MCRPSNSEFPCARAWAILNRKISGTAMKILPIPCLKDNYAYLLICEQTRQAAVIDPAEAGPVLSVLEQQQVSLQAILNTHHHWDHTGGNPGLLQYFPELEVFGHALDQGRIPGQTRFLRGGDAFQLGALELQVLHNPGHTRGAISYRVGHALFTGDTLFGGGCGRTFEGTAAEMYHSLQEVIAAEDPQTLIYFGHEYTLRNLEFALWVEPHSPALRQRLHEVQRLRQRGLPTVPSQLTLEQATNPFLRCQQAAVKAWACTQEPGLDPQPEAVFRVLRAAKDQF